MSNATGVIGNLTQALNCSGKCDCCQKLQQQINDLNNRLNQYIPKSEKPQIINESVQTAYGLILPEANEFSTNQDDLLKLFLLGIIYGISTQIELIRAAIQQLLNFFQYVANQVAELAKNISRLISLPPRVDALESEIPGIRNIANQADRKADTALTNSQQALEIGIGARSIANTALSTANGARSTANTALSTANGARSTANTALSTATGARSTANTALSTATGAKTTANTALSTATGAKTTANTALSTATGAKTTANTALSTATGAKTTANTALSTATGAKTTADTALSTATGARSTAERAERKADEALNMPRYVTNVIGVPGPQGIPGERGLPGARGLPGIGIKGDKGDKGESMDTADKALLRDVARNAAFIPALVARPAPLSQSQTISAAATGTCQTMQPGGCGDSAMKRNNGDLFNRMGELFNTGSNAVQNALLLKIDAKLGAQIAGGIGGKLVDGFKWLQIDRALNVLTMAATIHNGVMLSNDIGQTLIASINNVLQLVGLKDDKGQPFNIGEAISSTIQGLITSAVGAENYTALTTTWAKANRIYQSSVNVLNAFQGLSSAILTGLEMTAGKVGKIGNALRDAGQVLDNAYSWMNPQPKFNRVTQALENLQQGASTIQMVTQVPLDIIQATTDLTTQSTELINAIKDDTKPENKGKESPEPDKLRADKDAGRLVSVGADLSDLDLEADA